VLLEENVQRYTKGLYPGRRPPHPGAARGPRAAVVPAQFGTLQWRFGTAGLLLGNYGTILLGLGLFGLVAALQGNRALLRGVGFAAITLAVITLALLVAFTFDAIQIRALAQPAFKRQILTSSVGALFAGLLGTLTLVLLGRAALAASRATRTVASGGRARVANAPSPLVVGAAAPAANAREAV
jgi:hypothetical protein